MKHVIISLFFLVCSCSIAVAQNNVSLMACPYDGKTYEYAISQWIKTGNGTEVEIQIGMEDPVRFSALKQQITLKAAPATFNARINLECINYMTLQGWQWVGQLEHGVFVFRREVSLERAQELLEKVVSPTQINIKYLNE